MTSIATLTAQGWECVNPLPGPADVLARYANHTPVVPGMDTPSFWAEWIDTIVPEIGQSPFWLTDATATARPTVTDRLGIVRTCQINEARFPGARRIENLAARSNDLDLSPWAISGTATVAKVGAKNGNAALVSASGDQCFTLTSNGSTNALTQPCALTGAGLSDGILRPVRHTLRFEAYLGTSATVTCEVFRTVGGTSVATATVTPVATGWTVFALTFTPDGTNAHSFRFYSAAAGTVHLRKVQLQDMAGEPVDASNNVPPDEYVSRGAIVVSSQTINTWHGAMVDGVKYSRRERANTVNNTTRVVTEAQGPLLTLHRNGGTLKRLLLESPTTNRATGAETLSGWTINATSSLTVTTGAAAGPDGLTSAIRLTEDSATTDKYASRSLTGMADNAAMCVQAYALAGTAAILRLAIVDKAGAVLNGWFNVSGTTVSMQIDSGARGYMWREGAFWLCSLVDYNIGAGSNPSMRVGLATALGQTSYLGAGRTLLVWGMQATQKEHPSSYFNPDRFPSANRTGHALAVPNNGVIGRNNFAAYVERICYYDSGIAPKTTDGLAQAWDTFISFRDQVPDFDFNRAALFVRPFVETPPGYARFGIDRYLGDPTARLLHRTSTVYPPNSYVVPATTTSNNGNNQNLFFTANGGTSAASAPTWPASGSVTDGTITWSVAGFPNPSGGKYDPNDGAHLSVDVPAWTVQRILGGVDRSPDIWMCVNGVQSIQTTRPFPIDGSATGDLLTDVKEIRIGREAATYSIMSQHIGNLQIFDRAISKNLGPVATA